MMRCVTLFALVVFGWANILFGQQQMTLNEAISIALENNFNIKIAATNIEIAENNNSWARAGRGPVVDVGANLNNNLVNDNNPASFLQGTYYAGALTASANANWVLFNGGRIRLVKDQLDTFVNQEKLNEEIAIHDLLRVVIQQYNDILFQQARLSAILESYGLSQDRLRFEESRRDFGVSDAFNIIQFENALLADSTSLITQEQNIEVAKRQLFQTLDISYDPRYVFSETLSSTIENIDREKLKSRLEEDNYTIKTLEVISSLNAINTEIERANRKPVISASGSAAFARNAFKFYADNPNTGDPFPLLWSNRISGNITLNATWNIYDGGVRRDNVESAKLQNEIDRLNILDAAAQLNDQLDILVANYDNQIELIQLSQEQINVAKRNLEMTEERFKAGQISSIDFRNIQLQLLNIQDFHIANIYNLIILKSEIDYLVGRFDVVE